MNLRYEISLLKMRLRSIRKGVPHALPHPLVISLTSIPSRFATLDLTLRSLLAQDVAPDAVLLWVDTDAAADLPRRVVNLKRYGLSVCPCRDVGSYTKIVPALGAHPDAAIAIADDDVYYPPDWLRSLVGIRENSGEENPREIVCRRAHKVSGTRHALAPYRTWDRSIQGEHRGPLIFPTGVGGVLYPPGVLPDETRNVSAFLRICPKADDIWLYWMASLAGAQFRRTGEKFLIENWRGSQEVALGDYNFLGDGNDVQIRAMQEAYGIPPAVAAALDAS